MTPDMVTELLRNLYNASGGSVPPSAFASALAGMMWNETWANAWTNAGTAARNVEMSGGSVSDMENAFNEAFAETLGWTRGDFERFLEDNNLTNDNAKKYQEGVDLWEWMVNRNR